LGSIFREDLLVSEELILAIRVQNGHLLIVIITQLEQIEFPQQGKTTGSLNTSKQILQTSCSAVRGGAINRSEMQISSSFNSCLSSFPSMFFCIFISFECLQRNNNSLQVEVIFNEHSIASQENSHRFIN
jgi:hypothetical protein